MSKAIVVYGSLLVLSVACIVAAFFIPSHLAINGFSVDGDLARHIVNELGIAGLIGFILAITIERLSAAEFRKLAAEERTEIKRDVFHYVYGRNIPEIIRREIDQQILTAEFLRARHSVRFKLTTIKDDTSGEIFVLSECQLSYNIRNITSERLPFPLKHSIDKPPAATLLNRVKFTHLKVENSENPFDWDEPALQTKQKDEGIKIVLMPGREIVVSPKEEARVTVNYYAIRNLKGGRIDFTFTNYTCDLDLTVHVPDRELRVSAGAFSPHPLQQGTNHDPSAGMYNWILERPLLSHQGIFVTWDPLAASG